ncbi:MAG: stalk domain-containing protein [Bacillota bacterium]|nr:stalk domain-containing protein [Bacillota bacterium]
MGGFKKRILSFILIIILVVQTSSIYVLGFDDNSITQSITGKTVMLKIGSKTAFVDNKQAQIDPDDERIVPVIKNNRTLVPASFIAKCFGADVQWDDATATAKISINGREARFKPGSNVMTLNGKNIKMDVAASSIFGRLYIPLGWLIVNVLDKCVFFDKGFIIITENVSKAYRNKRVDNYMIYYGDLGESEIEVAKTYPLVIIYPTAKDITREKIREIQQGVNPGDPNDDVIVLAYISVGEDLRTHGKTYEEMLKDPRFTGDGTGPRVDPRGPKASGNDLSGIDPLGKPSSGGKGFASWYLDDNNFDGKPDWNPNFDVAYVNAGDPKWFETVNNMTIDGPDEYAGLKEILTDGFGRGLGCDGVFMDTVETCAPNSFTDDKSIDKAKFEWTAPGFFNFIKRLKETYPDKLVLQNRAFFFFDPAYPHYKYSPGKYLDYVFYESYRLNSNKDVLYNESAFKESKYNILPKLMAEAGRYNFQVLSLGYAEGPKNEISLDTLNEKSRLGYQELINDINEAQNYAGFRHYISNADISLVNNFVRDHSQKTDTNPPSWTSTFCDNNETWPPDEPTKRIGIQQVKPGSASATVRWDVALDISGVGYALYYQTKPFDFKNDPNLLSATRKVLVPEIGEGYESGTGEGVYPYQATIKGLKPGVKYYFIIRAFDKSPAANEDKNNVYLTVEPGE